MLWPEISPVASDALHGALYGLHLVETIPKAAFPLLGLTCSSGSAMHTRLHTTAVLDQPLHESADTADLS